MDNGDLLRTETATSNVFDAGGIGGSMSRYSWDNELLWSLDYVSDTVHSHHDIEALPNGHILIIAWELKTEAEVLAAGGDSEKISADGLWPDHLVEIDPNSGDVVWQWHAWDHLVQDIDASKPNYGVVADHPELIDLNYRKNSNGNDWMHTNAVDYHPTLDQIMLSIHNFSEIWIIDHSTTTEEAASHSGGLYGHGGDLLYRWGNPQVYDTGTADDQQLYLQHDAQWITDDLPGAGDILIFNNGDRQLRPWSTVVEIEPPLNANGTYDLTKGQAYGPVELIWEYQADPAENFYASNISGAQRLANGNTLICNGPEGIFFEVKTDGTQVWEYVNLYTTTTPQGEQASVFRAERYSPHYSGLTALNDNATEDPNTSDDVTDTPTNQPNLVAAAEALGVTVAELKEALSDQRPPNLREAAKTLEITVQELADALQLVS